MARRRPQTFERWALGLISSIVIALIGYQLSMARLDARLEHRQSAAADFLSKFNLQATTTPVRQLTPEEIRQAREAATASAAKHKADNERRARNAAEEAGKNAAWEKFFVPDRACNYPESPNRVKVCDARETKLREEFDRLWASRNATPSA